MIPMPHDRGERDSARKETRQDTREVPLRLLLAAPRGFCAGVERAVQIVEKTLERHGRPVYVRHEIVHNRTVVADLEAKGAIFVDELTDAPSDRPVIFSAHGVAKAVLAEAEHRHMLHIDATCPLVSKVHREVERHHARGRTVILIGHEGHPEVVGTLGQLPEGAILLVQNLADVVRLKPDAGASLAYATQTTLSVEDTAGIIVALKQRFPAIEGPKHEDICYATTNRQAAVRAVARAADAVLVIGAANSSNSCRLVDEARRAGTGPARLIRGAEDIDWPELEANMQDHAQRRDVAGDDKPAAAPFVLGLTAGASAPEKLVQQVIAACRARFAVTVEEITTVEEQVVFNLPRALRA